MQVDNNKIYKVLYTLIFLVVLNIGATGYLIYSIYNPYISQNIIKITQDLADETAANFIHLYNIKDYTAIYDMLDPAFKAEMTKESLKDTLENISSKIGEIDSFEYLSSYQLKESDVEYYTLFYRVRLNKGSSSFAEMKISILSPENPGIVGFYIHELENG